MCLLCFRQFESIEQLKRHTNESKMHATNLEDYTRLMADVDTIELGLDEYIDRASMRRVLMPVEAEKPEISDDVGTQLLKKMGWKEGEGLGKDSSGITEPIQPKGRSTRDFTGIGSKKN